MRVCSTLATKRYAPASRVRAQAACSPLISCGVCFTAPDAVSVASKDKSRAASNARVIRGIETMASPPAICNNRLTVLLGLDSGVFLPKGSAAMVDIAAATASLSATCHCTNETRRKRARNVRVGRLFHSRTEYRRAPPKRVFSQGRHQKSARDYLRSYL